jgi:hypothetical protein
VVPSRDPSRETGAPNAGLVVGVTPRAPGAHSSKGRGDVMDLVPRDGEEASKSLRIKELVEKHLIHLTRAEH